MVKRACKICKRLFFVKPYSVRRGWGIYCSRQCQYNDKTGKSLNCSVCGEEIYKTIQQIKRSKSKKYFCGKSCQTKWRNTQYTGKKHKNWKGGSETYMAKLERSGATKACTGCGNDDRRVLAVHHVDWNHGNNKLENLTWLCHNCHHLEHYGNVGT